MGQTEQIVNETRGGEHDRPGLDLPGAAVEEFHDRVDDEAGGEAVGDVEGEDHHGDGDECGNELSEVVELDTTHGVEHQCADRDQRGAVGEAELLQRLHERDEEERDGEERAGRDRGDAGARAVAMPTADSM